MIALLVGMALSALAGAQVPPASELYLEREKADLLAAARAVVASDPVAALVTVDAEGRPRVRSVEVRPPGNDFVLWIATRPTTRKLAQIEARPQVALYFNDDVAGTYLSVMGRATVHRDRATVLREAWMPEAARRELYPDFPDDCVLLEVRPDWLEVIAPGADPDDATWRPRALTFAPPDPP